MDSTPSNSRLLAPEDLQELSESSGGRFQKFVTALILEEGLSCDLSLLDIDADYRINHADGGCDIFVAKGQSKSKALLIPDKPSIWSIKSGVNGVKQSKLGEELKPAKHPRLIQHLKDGHVYLWCSLHPASQPERKKMRDKANSLAYGFGVNPNLIQFVWIEHFCTALSRYPNLIGKYLPKLHSCIAPMMTLAQWSEESPDKKGLKVQFVDVPGTTELQTRIKSHFLGNTGAAVLHLAGFSGIGKTRTTIETCAINPDLADVLYIGAFSRITADLWRRLAARDIRIRLVIDEVPLEEVTRLQDRFEGCGDRVRIVSIGPAPRRQARRQRDPMLHQLEPPDEKTGVLPIVSGAAPELSEAVRRSIAYFSGHDLRLALLLVEATRKNGKFSTAPIRDFEDVWKRIMLLFSTEINDSNRFREMYELLTLSIDVGHAGEHRTELSLVAMFFSKNEIDLDAAIRTANECGLGDRLQSFFEAKPAALAVWLFQEKLWPILQPRLEEFVKAKPSPRLLRRFLERCQETSGKYREEVESEIGRFFLTFLGPPDLKVLEEREASRIYQAWAEFDPVRGLDWLERAVVKASDDELRELTGDPDGSGGWRGRRQIVWLCEHLACFSDYFNASERILFRLAQVETEIRVGNNSTNTWRGMFNVALANTEVPFSNRLKLLRERLQSATINTINLTLSAFYHAMERPHFRTVPPSIVGGRIVPDPWMPGTGQDLDQCRLHSAKALLHAIPNLSKDIAEFTTRSVIMELSKFLDLGVVDELYDVLMPHIGDESIKRHLLSQLEEWLSWHDEPEDGP